MFVFCCHVFTAFTAFFVPSVLWHCWLGDRKGIRPVKNRVVGYWRGYRLTQVVLEKRPLNSCSWCQYHVLLIVMLYWVIESVVMFLCNAGSGALSQSYHVEFSYSVGSMDKQQSTSCMSPVVHSLSAFVCCFCTNLVFLFCFFKNYFRRLVSFLHQDKVHRFWSLTVFNTHI